MSARVLGFLAIVTVATLALGGRPAEACTNVTQADMDQSIRNLKIADAALEVDDFAKARKWVEPVIVYLNNVKSSIDPKDGMVHGPDGAIAPAPDPGLYRRTARLRSLLRSRDPKSTDAERESGLKMYEQEVLGTAPNPAVLADYAEIMSRVPARAAQATMTLRALRDKDLIGSAHAYAALAALEKKAGDQAAESAAREKCKPMTKVPAICG